jgi:hypothetical protein
MSDNVFRPQKPNNNDMPDLPDNSPLAGGQQTPQGSVQLSGNIPAELLARINGGGKQSGPNEDSVSRLPAQQYAPQQATMSGSSEFQEILNALKTGNDVYEEIELPSLGRFYDGTDGPLDGKLHIRPMTGEEEQILATPRFVRKGQAINMIFSRCIKEQFKPDNLLSVDRTFILIYLRGISYGSEYEVEVKDPESDRKFTTVIDLDTLPKENCPPDFSNPLQDTLPKSNLHFVYRLSKGKDETELQEYRERRLKQFGDSATDDTLLYRSAQLVESISSITNKMEIQQILKNLPIQDLSYLRGVVNEPPFGVDTKVTLVSPMSQEEFEVDLPLEANFFFPRRRKKDKTLA